MLIYDPDWLTTHPRPRTVAVYTPTRQYGGLDVTIAGLLRQDVSAFDCKLVWLLGDELYNERHHLQELADLAHVIPVTHWQTTTKPGYVRNLAATNNQALQLARTLPGGCDLFVFLQDFIWIPPDGIRRFLWLAEAFAVPCLISGLCSLTVDPEPSEIADPKGLYTIFAKPYTSKPQRIDWPDCRNDRRGPYVETPTRWETNWAAIPRQALYDERLAFDEEFDKGAAYENQDYAHTAMRFGYHPVVDTNNVALGLPHKAYWPAQYQAEIPQTVENKLRLANKNKGR